MQYKTRALFFYPCLLLAAGLCAQLEVNPYLARITGSQDIEVVTDNRQVERFEGERYAYGVDVTIGSAQLAPFLGLLYQPGRFRSRTARNFTNNRILLPVGLNYRLRQPDATVNLLLTAGLVPAWVSKDTDLPNAAPDREIRLQGRLGATLYLDMVTFGAHYYPDFGGDYLAAGQSAAFFAFTLGGRF